MKGTLLGKLRAQRLPVAGRLAIVFCGIAAFSTAATLTFQERALDRDLERAARQRLERSARAADRLLAEHLRQVAERYTAVSRTPELRANLEIDHAPTLAFFAERLQLDQGASLIAFEDPDLDVIAWSGREKLAESLPQHLRAQGEAAAPACVQARASDGQRPIVEGALLFRSCRPPRNGTQATLFLSDDTPYAVATVPLRTGKRHVGVLLVAEAIGRELLETWSTLCGAEVQIGRPPDGDDQIASVTGYPGGVFWISSSLRTERLALRGSRNSLVLAGLLGLVAAFAASVALARSLSRPLRAMREATEGIQRGDLSIRLETQRNDELGDLSRAFNSMLSRLDESQSRLRRVQQLARFGEWSLRFDTGLVEASPEFYRALGIRTPLARPLTVTEMLERIHPEDRTALRREVDRCRVVAGTFEQQVRSPRAAEAGVLLFRGRSYHGGDGARLEGSVQDLTEKVRVEEQIRYLSYHDPVTGLGNTRFFRERLLRSCSRSGRFNLMVVGLDNFQLINQSHGHSFGDEVLRGCASRLLEAVLTEPGISGSSRAIARLGGDQFGVLFDDVSSVDQARSLAEQLLDRLSQPHIIEGVEVVVTASVGSCFGTTAERSAEALLRNCDSALHRAKERGRERIEFFDELVREESSRRLRIDSLLRRALENEDLAIHFQPRVSARGEIVCFEALMRWFDPDLGAVSPAEFIPIAEQSGLIQSIGRWAMVHSLEQLRRWSEAGYGDTKVSINLSPHQFHEGIDREIVDLLDGLEPQRVELEVTESSLLRDEEAAIRALRGLRNAGFRISLDDFGTGYSSLSYLRRLPLDAIKIDRSFIRNMDRDRDAAALVESIVAMVRTLRLDIVAEGVETAEQREMLAEMGCDELQGLFFSPAVPSDAALRLLSERRGPEREKPEEEDDEPTGELLRLPTSLRPPRRLR